MIALMVLMMIAADEGPAKADEPTVRVFEHQARSMKASEELAFELDGEIGGKPDRRLRRPPAKGSSDRRMGPDFREVSFEVEVPKAFRLASKAVGVRLSLDGKANTWRVALPLRRGSAGGIAPWTSGCVTWPCWLVVEVVDQRNKVVWSWRAHE